MEGVNVFVVCKDDVSNGASLYSMSDDKFRDIPSVTCYSLAEFQEAFNIGEVNTYTDVIRIIEI